MDVIKFSKISFLGMVLTLFAMKGFTAQATIDNVTVNSILIDDSYYTTCMINVSPNPAASIGACGAGWLVLDCDGSQGTSAKVSQAKLAAAQLAYVSGGKLKIVFTDVLGENGYCFAQRVTNKPG